MTGTSAEGSETKLLDAASDGQYFVDAHFQIMKAFFDKRKAAAFSFPEVAIKIGTVNLSSEVSEAD